MKHKEWQDIIEKENREYAINSDAYSLAYYIMTWKKYAPEEELKDMKIDIMYESSVGGYYEYTEEEKQIIKNKI